MPIYEYRCDACQHELEAMHKMSDAPLTDCPECREPALQKRVSAAGFRLKGSGWYVTDFRGGSKAGPEKADRGDGGKQPSKGEASGCGPGGCSTGG